MIERATGGPSAVRIEFCFVTSAIRLANPLGDLMRISRHYTNQDQSPYDLLEFRTTASEIRNPDGSIVFRLDEMEVPKRFSQVASDVLAQKYFRKAGVPAIMKKVEENSVPSWLWRSVPDDAALSKLPEEERFIGEVSAKQVFDRLAGTLDLLGLERWLLRQRGRRPRLLRRNALHVGQSVARRTRRSGSTPACIGPMASTARARAIPTLISKPASWCSRSSAYEHPQPHACFIQSVSDDLVNEGGIMDLWVREARLFKYGSRHRHQLLATPRRGETVVGRRQVVRPDELS